MPNISDQLADLTVRNTVRILQLSKRTQQEIQGILFKLSRDLAEDLREADPASLPTMRQEKRLRELQRQTTKLIAKAYKTNSDILKEANLDQADWQMTRYPQHYNAVFQADLFSISLNATELKVLAEDPIVLGNKTSAHWRKQTQNLRHNYIQEVRQGLIRGETTNQIVNRIVGSPTGQQQTIVDPKTGRRRNVAIRSGGIMNVSQRDAQSLVRTSAITVNGNILQEFYKQNTEVLDGFGVLVTLDTGTTDICISLSGATWDLLTEKPLLSSPKQIHYPGPPAYHFNCRTVLISVVKSWADLGVKTKDKIFEQARNPNKIRASMNGEVPATTTYSSWLSRQPKEVQLDVLGPTTRKLWLDGKIELNQLTDSSLRSLTITELKALG